MASRASTLAALGTLGAHRLSVLTPYTVPVNQAIALHLAGHGLEVLNIAGFDLDQDDDMTAVPPDAIVAAGLAMCDPSADLLFISCTALRAATIIDELERRLGKPVVASNQALMWHALRLIGHRAPIPGFGRLLTEPLPVRAGGH